VPVSVKRWGPWLRLLVTAVVLAFCARAIARNWAAFQSVELAVDVNGWWLAASFGWVLVTTALQVESWRHVLRGWGQHLRYARAAGAWCLANLGRYVPGKVWSVAGLVVLAQRDGVAVWASTASAFAIQALGLGTCLAIIALTIPGQLPLLVTLVGAAGAIATLLALGSERIVRLLARLGGERLTLRALPARAIAASAALTFVSWATYGLAFWSLARAVGYGPGTGFTPPAAMGMFALGYLLGLLALLAPGGLGVREAVFVSLLTPVLGSGGAIALSVASRLQLTITEALAAGLAWLLARRASPPETIVDDRSPES
jgi:uncharacterized membrane protein YbhN (UPF0104 family)